MVRTLNQWQLYSLFFCVLTLSACGGGGGDANELEITIPASTDYHQVLAGERLIEIGGTVFVSTERNCDGVTLVPFIPFPIPNCQENSNVRVSIMFEAGDESVIVVTGHRGKWEATLDLAIGDNSILVWADTGDGTSRRGEDTIIINVPAPTSIVMQGHLSADPVSPEYFDFSMGMAQVIGLGADIKGMSHQGVNFSNDVFGATIVLRRIILLSQMGSINDFREVPIWSDAAPWVTVSSDCCATPITSISILAVFGLYILKKEITQ